MNALNIFTVTSHRRLNHRQIDCLFDSWFRLKIKTSPKPPSLAFCDAWWRHQMETFSALLALCAGNSPVTGEFPSQMPVTRSFDVFFDLRSNKRLSKQSWVWWSETTSRSLWRRCNGLPLDSPLIIGFPSQTVSNTGNISMPSRHQQWYVNNFDTLPW